MASNTDFLRFSAYSMKELITRKLSEDSKFTDQIYEGSNLAVLIDIISYIYQCLAFQLNSAAAESMFADTQLYKNMVRLVKFIGYIPRGCTPSEFTSNIKVRGNEMDSRQLQLPAFTYFKTQAVNSKGESVYFSIDQSYQFESDGQTSGINVVFYNGKWKLYSVVYTASGVENEQFVLEDLKSDSDAQQYVPGDFIKIVVGSLRADDGVAYSDGKYRYSDLNEWQNDKNGIFTRSNREILDLQSGDNVSTNLYNSEDKLFTVSLNENKQYEIKFGDGVTGRKLWPGDRIYVFYLDSDGESGQVDLADIDFSKVSFRHDYNVFSMPSEMSRIFGTVENLEKIFGADSRVEFNITPVSTAVTAFKSEESVDDIRENAPGWFKTGNRLITAKDTEYYIKTNSAQLGLGRVIDVKCMNNMQYIATLYKWLYENGIKSQFEESRSAERARGVDPGRYYLDNLTFDRANFKYIDPADANNTYLWIKTESDAQDYTVLNKQNIINDRLYHIKTITTEYQLVKPVLVNFAICANPDLDDIKRRYFNRSHVYFDQDCESYIEITLDDSVIYVSNNIQKLVYDEIVKAFDVNSQKLGGIVQFNSIVDGIYQINGVQRVRTIYKPGNGYIRAVDGISFASWSDENVLRFHEDLTVGNTIRHVEDFQFPVLEGEDLIMSRIKVISRSMQQVNTFKF